MVYLIVFITALLGVIFNNKMSSQLRKTYLVMLCIFMILVMGFRYKVGLDTYSYMHAYQNIPPLDRFFSSATFSRFRFEPGFLFICSLCKSFSHEFWPVQMIISAITTSCMFIFLNRYCRNVFIGITLFLILHWLYFSTEIMREGVAIGIFLLNFKNLQEKKWLNYYLLSIPSILFHYSAILIWFFPFTKWLKPNFWFILFCCIILCITPIVDKFNTLLNIAAISGRIDQYLASAETLNLNWRLAELFRSIPLVLTCLFVIKYKKIPVQFMHMILLQVIFCVGAFAIPLIFSRFTNYTTLFVTVTAANLLASSATGRWLKIALVAVVIVSQSYYYTKMKTTWFPYVSIFYPENFPERSENYRQQFFGWKKALRNL